MQSNKTTSCHQNMFNGWYHLEDLNVDFRGFGHFEINFILMSGVAFVALVFRQ